VLFRSTSDTIVAGMLLSLAYLKAIQWLTPFKDPALNRIKETSVWQIFFVFLIALLIKMDDVDSEFLAASLLLVFFANIVIWLGQCLVQCCEHNAACVSRQVRDGEKVMKVEMQGSVSPAVSSGISVSPAVSSGISPSGVAGSQRKSQSQSQSSSSNVDESVEHAHSPLHLT
jgi:hypothetical protein